MRLTAQGGSHAGRAGVEEGWGDNHQGDTSNRVAKMYQYIVYQSAIRGVCRAVVIIAPMNGSTPYSGNALTNRRHAVPSCGRSTLRPYKRLVDNTLWVTICVEDG